MARKNRFPPEADTRPDLQRVKAPGSPSTRHSGPAPKEQRQKAEASMPPATIPPPPTRRSGKPGPKSSRKVNVSDVREVRGTTSGATVDEVTADLSKDPRHERDGEE